MRRFTTALVLLALSLIAAPGAQQARPAPAQHITTPKEALGFDFGDDYQLADYKQIEAYWKTLDKESDRMVLHDMGKTAEGRTQWMAIVTSPENQKKLAHYQEISKRLGFAEGLTDAQAHALAKEGKAVVWIDGGLHATETLGAQQLGEMVYEMVSRNDEETRRFLDDCIILFVHANPDGNDLVADWYMRNGDPKQRSFNNLPRLYQKYIGHDNNRDFFASTQAETENINRALYHDWMPQILYNHHQSGPAGTIAWSSPQRDPYNYNLDPLLILGLQALGTHLRRARGDRREAGRDAGVGRRLRRLVERRHPQHRQLPQHHRHPDRDDRQPDADARAAGGAAADPQSRPPVSDRAAGVALQAVGRLLADVQPRHPRLRVAEPREPAVQHLPDGAAVDRARQRRLLDAVAVADQRAARERRPRRGAWRRGSGAGRRCASRSCAIRARSSSRRTSATSRRR